MRTKLAMVAALVVVGAAFAVGTGGAAAASSAKVSGLDEEWLSSGLQGDLFEVKGGKIAMQNSKNSEVKALGKTLMTDHSESFEDGAKLAKSLGIEVPKAPTYPEIWELGQVGSMKGTPFDKAYTSLEVLDHMQDIKDAKTEIANGTNKAVIANAKEELPMLIEHLALSKKAQQGS
jgi:putative membrane protein